MQGQSLLSFFLSFLNSREFDLGRSTSHRQMGQAYENLSMNQGQKSFAKKFAAVPNAKYLGFRGKTKTATTEGFKNKIHFEWNSICLFFWPKAVPALEGVLVPNLESVPPVSTRKSGSTVAPGFYWTRRSNRLFHGLVVGLQWPSEAKNFKNTERKHHQCDEKQHNCWTIYARMPVRPAEPEATVVDARRPPLL